MASKKIIGIDLGTTNSAVAVLEDGHPKIITNPEGGRTTPSVVAFKNGKQQVGDVAKRQMITNPNTVSSIKRHMGDNNYKVTIGNKSYTPQQISAMILNYIKDFSEKYIGDTVNQAIITVPAYFDDAQRQATRDAGLIAGLHVKRIINEPTAASLAYGLDKSKNQKILVYDLGGGTFDVSVLQLGKGVFQVLSTNGDTHLGGVDFDNRIINWLLKGFRQQYGIDLTQNRMAMQRLKDASEKAKKKLSSEQQTRISLPFIATGQTGPIHLNVTLTRDQFNKLTGDLVARTKKPFDKALKDAGLSAKDIDHVILNGGSTRIPAVQKAVAQWSGKAPDHSINPDEAVADGAAIQGGVLTGNVKNVVLLDVTPLSLGIETMGGMFNRLINRNTTIPTSKTKIFSTAADNQTGVSIRVFQGERPLVSDDKKLGDFQLTNIPPAPRGVPQIAVTFDIDKNGIVNVTAKDKSTGKSQNITIKNANGLSKSEIQKMRSEAVANATTDKRLTAEINLKHNVDQLVFQTDRTKDVIKGKLGRNEQKFTDSINKAEDKLRQARKNSNIPAMKADRQNLLKAVQSASIALYKTKQKEKQRKAKLKQKNNNGGN